MVVGVVLMHAAGALAQADSVLSVGSRELSVSEVQRYMDETPRKRVLALGKTAQQQKERFLEQLLVPHLLLEQEAEARLSSGALQPLGLDLKNRALSEALDRQLRAEVVISDAEISAFYEKYKAEYHRPLAIKLWRILVSEESAAKRIIEQVDGKGNGVELWWKLAREQSLDDATKYRYGDLGFVRASGQTDVPQVRVNAVLFDSVKEVKDGEFAPAPVREGEYWAVVWRRGTRPAQTRTLEEERASILQILTREAAFKARQELVQKLRTTHLKDFDPGQIEAIDYPEASVKPRPKPPKSPRPAVNPQKPEPTLRGDR